MSKAEQFYDLIMRTGSIPPPGGDPMDAASHPVFIETTVFLKDFVKAHKDGGIFLRGLAVMGGYAASVYLKAMGRSLTDVSMEADLRAAQKRGEKSE